MKPERHKYQFSIIINNETTNNSAATKAVLDCRRIFTSKGYKDYTLYFYDTSSKFKYAFELVKEISKFLFQIKKGSIVGVQYPILNNVFKYFIKIAKLKNISFFCIIHDIESLRLGATDKVAVIQEVRNLNHYDCLIVHNPSMEKWLKEKGITKTMVPLMIFDYLSPKPNPSPQADLTFSRTICFAGNLSKSSFIYHLNSINNWNFTVYGPNFLPSNKLSSNVRWGGEFSPEQIVSELKGDFGLIWDGVSVDKCDDILGNYLRYNNPHKFSLYLAAGIPVIAPAESAIGQLIKKYKIGILLNSLHDLAGLEVDDAQYRVLKQNCIAISKNVTTGNYFLNALDAIEKKLSN